jgi:hypothetical protein
MTGKNIYENATERKRIKVTNNKPHGSVVQYEKRTSKDLRWKSQRMKIHRLGLDFCRFLNPYPRVSFFGYLSHLVKASRPLVYRFFFLRLFKFIGWYGFSSGFLVALFVFHQYFV